MYSHLFNSLKLNQSYFELQQTLTINESDIRNAIHAFVIEEIPSSLPETMSFKIKINIKKGDYRIKRSYILVQKKDILEEVRLKFKNEFSSIEEMIQEI